MMNEALARTLLMDLSRPLRLAIREMQRNVRGM